jgi:hypothetical protein
MRFRRFAHFVLAFTALVATVPFSLTSVPMAHAAGVPCGDASLPCIQFQNLIYGQDIYPKGPPGAHLHITGVQFDQYNGISLDLAAVPGDNVSGGQSEIALAFCRSAPKVFFPSAVTVSGGAFDTTLVWPAAAAGPNKNWTICAYTSGDRTAIGNSTDGHFTVLTTDPLSISLSALSAQPGTSISVTGHNWLPDQDLILVRLAACATCSAVITDVSANSTNGEFTTVIPLPANLADGSYVVTAFTPDHALDVAPDGVQPLTIGSLAPTATTEAPGTTNHSTSGPATENTTLILLGGAVVLLLLLVLFTLFTVRSSQARRRRARIAAAQSSLASIELAARQHWGVDYWFDTERMAAGSDLSERIQRAIQQRDIFLRICTGASQISYWVKLETGAYRGLQAADDHSGQGGKRVLINLILDRGYVPEPFDYAHIYIDATTKRQEDWLGELRHALGVARPVEVPPPEWPRQR